MAMSSRGLLRAVLVAGAAIATSSFVGVPAGAGLSRHARASSRAVRMMAYKVPEATQEEWVASRVESKRRPASLAQAAVWPRLAGAHGSLGRDLALADRGLRRAGRGLRDGSFGTQVEGQSGLYKERIVYLGQEIDDLVINQIISVMLFADAEDATKEQYLYINSPGGSVIAGLALYDTFG